MTKKQSNLVDIGRVGKPYGLQGWVNIQSFTEPADNILQFQPWWLKTRHGVKSVTISDGRPHGKGFVAHITGVDDRDAAEALCRVNIAVEKDQLPALAEDEFYWHQLENLVVFTEFEGKTSRLGKVKTLLETGANDVLVVVGDADSLDQQERLIPYVPDQFVTRVDLDAGEIWVAWDPEF